MSTVVPIPGGTATLRDKLVSERQFRFLESAFMTAAPAMAKLERAGAGGDMPEEERAAAMGRVAFTREESDAMLALQDAAIVAFLEDWSLNVPLPTIANVEDLSREVYQALALATQGRAADELGGADFSPNPSKESPTTGSSSSDGLSGDAAPSPSRKTSRSAGASIPSVA